MEVNRSSVSIFIPSSLHFRCSGLTVYWVEIRSIGEVNRKGPLDSNRAPVLGNGSGRVVALIEKLINYNVRTFDYAQDSKRSAGGSE